MSETNLVRLLAVLVLLVADLLAVVVLVGCVTR